MHRHSLSCGQLSVPHGGTSVTKDLKLEKCPVAARTRMLDSRAMPHTLWDLFFSRALYG